MNIVNPLGCVFRYSCTADSFTDGDADAGDFALERPQQQAALIDDIEACPVDGRKAVPEQGRRIGKNGKPEASASASARSCLFISSKFIMVLYSLIIKN